MALRDRTLYRRGSKVNACNATLELDLGAGETLKEVFVRVNGVAADGDCQ